MGKSNKTAIYTVPPGFQVPGRTIVVPIKRIPAVDEVAGSMATEKNLGEGPFIVGRRIFAKENPDLTYSVLIDLELIKPELARFTGSHVEITALDFRKELAMEEDLLRKYCMLVDANRRALSDPELLGVIKNGALDGLAPRYTTKRLKERGLAAMRLLFGVGQIVSATFYRHQNDNATAEVVEKEPAPNRSSKDTKQRITPKPKPKKSESPETSDIDSGAIQRELF